MLELVDRIGENPRGYETMQKIIHRLLTGVGWVTVSGFVAVPVVLTYLFATIDKPVFSATTTDKLSKGMSPDDVKKVLGEPSKIYRSDDTPEAPSFEASWGYTRGFWGATLEVYFNEQGQLVRWENDF